MKLLNGAELAGYIKERQARQVRGLRQAAHIYPKLVIIDRGGNTQSRTYIQDLQTYGDDILVDVAVQEAAADEIEKLLNALSNDRAVHGVLVWGADAQAAAAKDVTGLAPESPFDAAVPMAVLWLLAGYAIDLPGKQVAVVGAGAPIAQALAQTLESSGITAQLVPAAAQAGTLPEADVVLIAEAPAGTVQAAMLKPGAVVVDATEDGNAIAADVYQLTDIAVTPQAEGLGELATAALFDNVLRAARQAADKEQA